LALTVEIFEFGLKRIEIVQKLGSLRTDSGTHIVLRLPSFGTHARGGNPAWKRASLAGAASHALANIYMIHGKSRVPKSRRVIE